MFGKSENFKEEYCCSIIRVGEIKPIAGKDKIGFTLVNGESIVIRKDQVKEGDILIYASNESELNKDFLGANNLFETNSYELNSNASDVEKYILKNKDLKPQLNSVEKNLAKLDNCIKFVIRYESEVATAEGDEDILYDLSQRLAKSTGFISGYINRNVEDFPSLVEFVNEAEKVRAEKETLFKELKSEIEANTEYVRSRVGFFNKTGRVRSIRLGGVVSKGYLFTLEELAKYNPKVKDINLEEYLGQDFDTVDGELFVKAYVPFVPEKRTKTSSAEKRNKKIVRFDRMIEGEFSFNYDSLLLPKNIHKIKPTDSVAITVKVHGTSFVCGKVHVKTPIKLPFIQRMCNKFIDLTGWFKKYRTIDYKIEYGNVTSSRKVIKNKYINKDVTDGYYSVDVYSEYGELIYPYLSEGMTVYGEIFGYLTNNTKMIQKQYDYGCEVGTNKLMPYRITTSLPDGGKYEWNVEEVKDWTEKLIKEHPEIADRIHVIDLLYHGTLADLYPTLSLTEHWNENVLEELRNDKKHFGMEKNEPLCENKVPREGLCIRIDDDETNENFKLKCQKFYDREKKLMDEGEVDIEMGLASAE